VVSNKSDGCRLQTRLNYPGSHKSEVGKRPKKDWCKGRERWGSREGRRQWPPTRRPAAGNRHQSTGTPSKNRTNALNVSGYPKKKEANWQLDTENGITLILRKTTPSAKKKLRPPKKPTKNQNQQPPTPKKKNPTPQKEKQNPKTQTPPPFQKPQNSSHPSIR